MDFFKNIEKNVKTQVTKGGNFLTKSCQNFANVLSIFKRKIA